jgi:2,3-bisphosphoglycerate-independent phosphoglycerate mutase
MKYVIVIPDGCADDACAALGDKTPLQAAHLPNLDHLVQTGNAGLTNNVPDSLAPASDVATLSLFGYDPLQVYTGRAPLEAAALGVKLGPDDWAIRCNLVHVADGLMKDFTTGHITSDEGKQLIDAVRAMLPHKELLELVPGVSYRNLMIMREVPSSVIDATLLTQPPHDIPDRPIDRYLPQGTGGQFLRSLMDISKAVLPNHPVNQKRRSAGLPDATQIWLWGQGKAPQLERFADLHHLRGAITTGVDLVRGVGALLGWDRLEAPGITDYIDNDYAAQAKLAIDHLDNYDLICIHVEAPDEASHAGLADEKVKALEIIDDKIVRPVVDALRKYDAWRILVSPDHRTPLTTRAHSYGPVPFVMAGSGINSNGADCYDEKSAKATGKVVDPGWKLMGEFLGNA